MKSNQPAGFRIHLRYLAILVVYFAILLGIVFPMARELGARGQFNPGVLILLATPWILAVLVLALGRKSPVKFWLAPSLLSLLAPALAISQDWAIVASWIQTQRIPDLLLTLVINIVLIASFTFFAAEMCPRHCPDCKRRAMIPLRNLWGPGTRTPNTRWCARCGARYWRTTDGEWREERRRTWLDNVKQSRKVGVPPPDSTRRAFRPEERVVAPMIASTRVKTLVANPDAAIAPETRLEVGG